MADSTIHHAIGLFQLLSVPVSLLIAFGVYKGLKWARNGRGVHYRLQR